MKLALKSVITRLLIIEIIQFKNWHLEKRLSFSVISRFITKSVHKRSFKLFHLRMSRLWVILQSSKGFICKISGVKFFQQFSFWMKGSVSKQISEVVINYGLWESAIFALTDKPKLNPTYPTVKFSRAIENFWSKITILDFKLKYLSSYSLYQLKFNTGSKIKWFCINRNKVH